MPREGLVVAQEELVLELTAANVLVEEAGQEEHMDDDRACDEQDYTAEGDILENKDADNEVQGTCSAGGKDKEHVDTLPAIEHIVEADKHEEANVHTHEQVMMNEHMSLVVNAHESVVVVVQAQVWWELIFATPPCYCAILVWRRKDEELRTPWGLSF